MSSMGLFDVKGLSESNPSYQVGSPLFDRITIALPQDVRKRPFIIEVEGNSPSNIYVQELLLDGKPMDSYSLPYHRIVEGGTLKLKMGNTPNTSMTR